jgi:hypothetical protein
MGAEPAVFGAFYRRFEDEVLGYFLARGARPEVVADLTAETFAAALPSRRWKRLANEARKTLEASCRAGRVVADGRKRRGMPPLLLTDDSVARIAALAGSKHALATELRVDDEYDVRVRLIDESDFEQLAPTLRLSDAIVRSRTPDVDAERAELPRIPELEEALRAAAEEARRRNRGAIVAAAGVAVAVLAFLALTGSEDHRAAVPPANATATPSAQLERSLENEIVQTGNAWAASFAAARQRACLDDMTQPACERIICDSVRGPLENCVPLPRSVQRSFRDATVQDVVVNGRRASARFSNGEFVEFVDGGPHSPWLVDAVGKDPGRIYDQAQIVLHGNAWAPFFAASRRSGCGQLMTQRACERVNCKSVSGPVENCVPLSARFKRSFRDATVEDVLVIKGRRAAARFSNGEVVAFYYVRDGGGRWWVDRLGPDAARGVLAH